MSSLALRDHAGDILLATVRDMESVQTAALRADKSSGYDDGSVMSRRLNGASEEHAIGRLGSGFNLSQLVSEYRALRASVLSLWRKSRPSSEDENVDDVTLFHESIDESLATAITCFTKRIDESRDMFLAILSHDLRSPLSTIAMSASMLPRVDVVDSKTSLFVSTISNSAVVMTRMINDLLDYTRTRLGAGLPVNCAPTDLGMVCKDVIGEFQFLHPTVTLRFKSTGDVTGEWDTARLRQVVSNLLGNAIQHGDRTAPIEVTVKGEAANVSVAIRNQGVPIPKGEQLKIFDPLVRGADSQTAKQNRPGSIGLGLYIARELVTVHNGTIEVESSPETGTVFTFHLPRHVATNLPETHPGASLTPA
ncbi:MAG TPA: HAMP domain-containing sensor histidine kinase [Tepidisphaeraceae bacterium]|nr:HAMP domain-containing sensor histidine kinase [Tepidisphaeraceae bacterium]